MNERAQSQRPARQLGVVIPMYNEISAAADCVRRVTAVLPSLDIPARLIIVDDGSADGTGALLDRLQREFPSIIVVHQPNTGYGGALKRGAQEAAAFDCDYVLFMDSDLTNPPEHLSRFLPAIGRGFDLVKGDRLDGPGGMSQVRWRRRFYTIVGNIIARTLFRMGLHDCTNGFRAIRTDAFLEMPLHERGFPVILEELYWAKRRGLTVTSVPTALSERSAAQRPSAFEYRPKLLWAYLKYALRAGLVSYTPRTLSD